MSIIIDTFLFFCSFFHSIAYTFSFFKYKTTTIGIKYKIYNKEQI